MGAAADGNDGEMAAAIVEARALIEAAPFATTDAIRAKGSSYLDGMIASSRILATSVVEAPRFVRLSGPANPAQGVEPQMRAGLDNPDNDYWQAQIDPRCTYVIDGVRGSSCDINFQLLDGNYADGHHELPESLGTLTAGQLGVAAGERYRVTLGGEPQADPWMALPDGATTIFFRETYSDWSTERPGSIAIRRTSGPSSTVGVELDTLAAEYLLTRIRLWLQYGPGVEATVASAAVMQQLPANQVFGPLQTRGGLPDQFSASARFRLDPDQALVITAAKTEAPYAGIQLGDHWFTSLDFLGRQTSLTTDPAVVDEDGMLRYVVAHRDPGVANWLDTTGLEEGHVFMRWQGSSMATPPPPVTAEVLAFDRLETALPSGTLRVTGAERAAAVAARLDSYLRREQARPPTVEDHGDQAPSS